MLVSGSPPCSTNAWSPYRLGQDVTLRIFSRVVDLVVAVVIRVEDQALVRLLKTKREVRLELARLVVRRVGDGEAAGALDISAVNGSLLRFAAVEVMRGLARGAAVFEDKDSPGSRSQHGGIIYSGTESVPSLFGSVRNIVRISLENTALLFCRVLTAWDPQRRRLAAMPLRPEPWRC